MEIVVNPTDQTFGISVRSVGEASVCPSFFTGVGLDSYPKMIKTVVAEVGFGSNAVGVTFPGDLDHTEEPIPEGMLEIYLLDEEDQVNQLDFYSILLEFARELLRRKTEREHAWKKEMQESIYLLQTKLEGLRSGR